MYSAIDKKVSMSNESQPLFKSNTKKYWSRQMKGGKMATLFNNI